MPRVKQNLEKVTIRLTTGAKDELEKFYPNAGYNVAIRKIVDNHIKRLNEKLNDARSQTNDTARLDDFDISLD